MKYSKTALVLAGLSALGPFSVDTYFPSFPAIAAHFGVSQLEVQSTLSFYLVTLAVMNLFHGALSDSFGRRRVIVISLGVYAVAALASPIVPQFWGLLALRAMQGVAAGAGMTVGRAIIRDRFDGADAHRFMAQVTMVGGLAPAVAPIVGGWLHVWFGWRGPFVFLGLFGLVLLVACYRSLPETLPPEARQPFHPAKLLGGYFEVISTPAFVCLAIALSFGSGGFLLYVATAPDVVLNILGLSETQFGWLFVPIVIGYIGGSAMSARIAGRVAASRVIRWAYGLMISGAVSNLLYNLSCEPRIPWALVPLLLYTFGFALFAPLGTIYCLDLFPRRRGLASSLQGFAHVFVFALISGVVAGLIYGSGVKHALAMALLLAVNWPAWKAYCYLATKLPASASRPASAAPPS